VWNSQLCGRPRRARNSTTTRLQCRFNDFSFTIGEFPFIFGENARARKHAVACLIRLPSQPRLVNRERFLLAENYSTFNNILQFTDIPWPVVCLKQIECLPLYAADFLPDPFRVAFDQILHKQGNITLALPQRWHPYREYIKTVEEIFAEGARRDRCFQITICGSDHSNINEYWFATPSSFKFPFLQHTQERNLRLCGKITDLIQEDRSAIGRFEPPQATLNGAGEGAFLMTEKLGSD